jgi:lysozyme family protein
LIHFPSIGENRELKERETTVSVFDRAFQYVVSPDVEGDLSLSTNDPGNWTGGHVNAGQLRGTKYGISAAQYPELNISQLTLDDARAIYLKDFWNAGHCDQLPGELAFCFFDACVNEGVAASAKVLQRALGIEVDGIIGPATIHAVHELNEEDLVVYFQGERILSYSDMTLWHSDGRGWTRRTVRTAIHALAL